MIKNLISMNPSLHLLKIFSFYNIIRYLEELTEFLEWSTILLGDFTVDTIGIGGEFTGTILLEPFKNERRF